MTIAQQIAHSFLDNIEKMIVRNNLDVGELTDMVKKWIFHESNFDEEHAKKELGDVMWYIAMTCESFGWSLDEIKQMNIDKLKKRYPDGFDTERANNRSPEDV